MKRRFGLVVVVAVLVLAGAKWEAYVPRTLGSVIEANRSKVAAGAPHFLAKEGFPTKARVVYDGRLQPIPAERYAFLADSMAVKGHPEWAKTFTTEILCGEGEARYWIPLQGPLVPRIGKEIAPGDPLDIYVTLVGANRKGSDLDWVFTINEFLPVPAGAK